MYLIQDIIPSADYTHRNGFSNERKIDQLSKSEKLQLEDELIEMLLNNQGKGVDTLVTETLAYLRSQKAVPIMMQSVNWCSYEMCKLSIYSSIFKINGDESLIDLAIRSFRKLEEKKDSYHHFTLIDSFYFLAKFHKQETDNIIKGYLDHKDYLVSYNAKQSLGMPTK